MAENQWGEEAPPPKKKSIPTWAWFCGGGCLLALLALVIGGWLMIGWAKRMTDPAVQWPKLAEVLPYDARPDGVGIEGLELASGTQMMGVQQYSLHDEARGLLAVLQRMPGDQGDGPRRQLFQDDEPSVQGGGLVYGLEQVEKGTLDVQGRTLPIVRCIVNFEGLMKKLMPEEAEGGMGATAYLDLTDEEDGRYTLLQLSRLGNKERIRDEEIQEFLRPFHVGPNR
jgi:hypothetical protein